MAYLNMYTGVGFSRVIINRDRQCTRVTCRFRLSNDTAEGNALLAIIAEYVASPGDSVFNLGTVAQQLRAIADAVESRVAVTTTVRELRKP
jgi:hypothetical protein